MSENCQRRSRSLPRAGREGENPQQRARQGDLSVEAFEIRRPFRVRLYSSH